jgi:hypothetical protein
MLNPFCATLVAKPADAGYPPMDDGESRCRARADRNV